MKRSFILLPIITIGVLYTSCSKEDLGSEEKILVNRYWYFCGNGLYYPNSYFFYNDHTYYCDNYKDESGTWIFSSEDCTITTSDQNGNTSKLSVTNINKDALSVKYSDGYIAVYEACKYENINLEKCEKLLIGSWNSGYIFYENHTFKSTGIYNGGGTWKLSDGSILALKYDKTQSWGNLKLCYILSITDETATINLDGHDYSWERDKKG